MADFENPYIKDESLDELIDALGPPTAKPGTMVHETMKRRARRRWPSDSPHRSDGMGFAVDRRRGRWKGQQEKPTPK